MAWLAPLIGAAGSLAGGAIGASQGGADRQAAKDAWQASVNQYNGIQVPTVQGQELNLQGYQNAGQLDPTQMQGVKLGDSNMQGISTDPQYRQAQLQALGQLQQLGSNGGMQLSDQAALENTMNQVRSQEQGARGAILQNAQQQGGYGNGMSVMAQLQNQQNAANLEHQAGLGAAAQGQQRALQSIISAGQMGGQMQQQDFGQQAQKAQAQDSINQWNAQNQQGVNQYNTGLQNYGQQYNLQNQQNLSNANVGLQNQQQMYNKGLQQQQFNNQMGLASGAANARAGQANNYNQQGNNIAQGWANMGGGLAQAGAGIGQYQANQANQQNQNEQNALDRKAYGGGQMMSGGLATQNGAYRNFNDNYNQA